MTPTRWRHGLATLRHTPALLVVQKIVRQVPFRPVDVGKLCFLQLDGLPHVRRSQLRGSAIVRRGAPEDLDGLVRLRDQRTLFLERFAAGDHCVVAEVNGRVVGYEWFCERESHRERSWGYRIAIPHGYVYAYDCYIDTAHRNTGVWLRFKAYLADLMEASGKRGVLTFVDYGNWPSLVTHLRFGFRPGATVLAVRVLGRLISVNLAPLTIHAKNRDEVVQTFRFARHGRP